MKASVIVLNYNSGPPLDQCIESLLKQNYPDYELLLVDNASTDGSAQRIAALHGHSPRLRIIWSQKNLGCAGGRNHGMMEARGDIFCFVDSDAFAEPGWLGHIVRAFEPPHVGVVASCAIFTRNPYLLNGLGGTVNAQGYGFDLAFGEPVMFTKPPAGVLYACGNGLCTRREVVAKIGGMDEPYFNYYEDVDFSLRARRAGYEVALASEAVLHHLLSGSDLIDINQNKIMLCERNRIRTVLRHYRVGDLLRWLPRELKHERDVRHKYPPGVFRRAWAWNLLHLGEILWWRLRCGLPAAAIDRYVAPTWGHAPFKAYNFAFRPDETRWSPGLTVGTDDERSLLYGWHALEQTEEGVPFRWSDDLAGLGLRTATPVRSVRIQYRRAEEHAETYLYLFHPESGQAATARLPPSTPHTWTTYEANTNLPPGNVHVILQSPTPYQEPLGGRRSVSIGVRQCEIF
jgi:N-acetylglucosaminyl-diphospho-decaprenol L-rhamnosyltransferase